MTKYMLLLRSNIENDYSGFSPDDMQKVLEGYEAWAGKLADRIKLGHRRSWHECRSLVVLATHWCTTITPAAAGVCRPEGEE